MTNPLAVLVLESHDGVADEAVRALEAAGHRALRCHASGDPAFPCAGLAGHTCPVDTGVDVAVTVRRADAGEPTALEDGVGCALRAGVPVVEQGGGPSPFAPWTVAAGGDLVEACESAAATAFGPLQDDVLRRVAPVAARNGLGESDLGCEITAHERVLQVRLVGPPVSFQVQQALSVRALDAVRSSRRPFIEVSVGYQTAV